MRLRSSRVQLSRCKVSQEFFIVLPITHKILPDDEVISLCGNLIKGHYQVLRSEKQQLKIN